MVCTRSGLPSPARSAREAGPVEERLDRKGDLCRGLRYGKDKAAGAGETRPNGACHSATEPQVGSHPGINVEAH